MDEIFNSIFNNSETKDECCPLCGSKNDKFVIDNNEGMCVCSNCGTCITDRLLSAKSDWQDTADCNFIINPLLTNQSKTTWLTGVSYWMKKNHEYCNVYSHGEQGLNDIYKVIDKIGTRNHISQAILDYIKKYCKDIKTKNMQRGKLRLGLIGALIGFAYKEKKIYYSEGELANICKIEKKYIQSGVNTLAKFNFDKGISSGIMHRDVSSYLAEYSKKFQLNPDFINDISNIYIKIQNNIPRISNTPPSIAGACIYYIYKQKFEDLEDYYEHLENFKIVLKKKCNLNFITVNNCYQNILHIL